MLQTKCTISKAKISISILIQVKESIATINFISYATSRIKIELILEFYAYLNSIEYILRCNIQVQ